MSIEKNNEQKSGYEQKVGVYGANLTFKQVCRMAQVLDGCGLQLKGKLHFPTHIPSVLKPTVKGLILRQTNFEKKEKAEMDKQKSLVVNAIEQLAILMEKAEQKLYEVELYETNLSRFQDNDNRMRKELHDSRQKLRLKAKRQNEKIRARYQPEPIKFEEKKRGADYVDLEAEETSDEGSDADVPEIDLTTRVTHVATLPERRIPSPLRRTPSPRRTSVQTSHKSPPVIRSVPSGSSSSPSMLSTNLGSLPPTQAHAVPAGVLLTDPPPLAVSGTTGTGTGTGTGTPPGHDAKKKSGQSQVKVTGKVQRGGRLKKLNKTKPLPNQSQFDVIEVTPGLDADCDEDVDLVDSLFKDVDLENIEMAGQNKKSKTK